MKLDAPSKRRGDAIQHLQRVATVVGILQAAK
jgi:hypothetical protein